MKVVCVLVVLAVCLSAVMAEVHFEETFGDDWSSRWVQTSWKKSEGTLGQFVHTAGDFYGDAVADRGIKTSTDARFYGISSKISTPFSNKNKDLVLQFTVRHPQNLDCGGGYIKLSNSKVNQHNFGGDSAYSIMFGPDMCGTNKKTHVIFNYNGKNLENKKSLRCETDVFTHLYTLIVKPDNTYEVQIDQSKVDGGKLEDDYDMLAPKMIKDPTKSKPLDWVDEAKIKDVTDFKPAGWDDIPEEIVDPSAVKPDEWDDDADGEWEAPTIRNPEFKGEWVQKMIDNPEYKGEWEHPMVPNPDYKFDENLYLFNDLGLVGIELWQVKSGSIFDNILVTDDINHAKEFARKTWKLNKDKEKKMYEKLEADKKAEEEAKKSAEVEEPVNDEDNQATLDSLISESGHDEL